MAVVRTSTAVVADVKPPTASFVAVPAKAAASAVLTLAEMA